MKASMASTTDPICYVPMDNLILAALNDQCPVSQLSPYFTHDPELISCMKDALAAYCKPLPTEGKVLHQPDITCNRNAFKALDVLQPLDSYLPKSTCYLLNADGPVDKIPMGYSAIAHYFHNTLGFNALFLLQEEDTSANSYSDCDAPEGYRGMMDFYAVPSYFVGGVPTSYAMHDEL